MSIAEKTQRESEKTLAASQQREVEGQKLSWWHGMRDLRKVHWITWLCLLLACLGTSWFSYQYSFVPQTKNYAPVWGQSHWIQAADGNTPVAYFRHVSDFNALPDAAFVTVAAGQNFRLYLNGTFVGSNSADFAQGNLPQAYVYDVTSLLKPGPNTLGVRVANADQQAPSLRVNLGLVSGHDVSYQGSDASWQATAQSANVYPRYESDPIGWTTSNFAANAWLPATQEANPASSPQLTADSQIYQQPLPAHWLSPGIGQEAYFVRQISVPSGTTEAWLRLAASGQASVFVNGQLSMIWDSQVTAAPQNVASYLSNNRAIVRYRRGSALGISNISPYLHTGINTIAVHVLAPGTGTSQAGVDNLNAALSLDMLLSDSQKHDMWLEPDSGWHASYKPVDGWAQGASAALAWQPPVLLNRPGTGHIFYLPDNTYLHATQFASPTPAIESTLVSIGAILGFWLALSLLVMRRYYSSLHQACEGASLVYPPALALEALLIMLANEPQLSKPFPYTAFWGAILILLVGASSAFLWLRARSPQKRSAAQTARLLPVRPSWLQAFSRLLPIRPSWLQAFSGSRFWQLLRTHWGFVLIVLLAIPFILYNLPYEPYWQDELTSYFAAKGILAHGIPVMPSGFLYPKGELYSYLLAASIALFGDQAGTYRIISAVAYLVSLPLMYGIGWHFFDRRSALLATAMLAFSPFALLWGRQMRMYEQAQVLTLLTVYLFYKALQEPKRARPVYLAVACLVATYLSHEETFIILPALVVCALVTQRETIHRLPAILFQKHWWYAAAMGAAVIGLQLLIVHVSHPPMLGTDQSQRPLVQFTTENVPYYIKILFFPNALDGKLPWITLNSLLATAGCIWALRGRDMRMRYCVLFLIISSLTLVLAFTLASERYIYPLLPLYYLLGAYALLRGLRALWDFASSRIESQGQSAALNAPQSGSTKPNLPLRMVSTATLLLVYLVVLIAPMLPLTNYNLFVSRATGLAYHRHFPDYDAVGQYMQQHWRKGDVVITVSPAISILHYVGHVDYFFSMDRALYLFERDGHIIDTPTGSIALLNQDDLQAIVASHGRIWIISDNAQYQSEAVKNRRFVFPPDFRVVFEGYGSAVYLRGG